MGPEICRGGGRYVAGRFLLSRECDRDEDRYDREPDSERLRNLQSLLLVVVGWFRG